MITRRLGATGPKISAMGYGAMSFSNFYGATNDANSFAILDTMRETGVTHIDTANVYGMGRSEEFIGRYLAANPESRGDFTIATKAGIARDADGNRYFGNDRAYLEAELDKSLARLGVEQVALFYVHRRNPGIPIEEVTESLVEIVKTGKAASFGFSEIAPSSLRRAAAIAPVAAVQSEYSLSTRAPELGLVQTCAELGTAFVAFSPVGRSFLTDNPLSRATVDEIGGWIAANPRFYEPNYGANITATDRLRALATEMGEPTAALAIAWLLTRGDHVIPIPGTRSVEHFRQCLRGVDLVLTEGDLARIETALPTGWAHGDRYGPEQWEGPERYC